MFAGLPGIGVGSLFYVLMALWMPVPELLRVARGTSSIARWRRIVVQLSYAMSIVVSIMFAERVMLWVLGAAGPGSMSPARFLSREFSTRAPQSILAAPVTASFILLVGVLLSVELLRIFTALRRPRRTADVDLNTGFPGDVFNSSTPQ